jgi:hypothetical protein
MQYTKEKEEQAELAELHNLINGGAHPGRQEVREAVAAANRKQTPVDMESINFIAVPYFMGEREGFEFKDGTDGLGYYKLLKKSTTKIWTRHRPDDACSPPGGSIATGPRKHRSGGFNPVEQAADEQQRLHWRITGRFTEPVTGKVPVNGLLRQ